MSGYLELIERSRLVDVVNSTSSTGGVAYPGTALEVADADGRELFHVVVDGRGRRQVLFFATPDHYRLPLELVERALARAKEVVGPCPEEQE